MVGSFRLIIGLRAPDAVHPAVLHGVLRCRAGAVADAGASALRFCLARPSAKSLPIISSMLMYTCISFDINGPGPCISHVPSALAPCRGTAHSGVLRAGHR